MSNVLKALEVEEPGPRKRKAEELLAAAETRGNREP
jgi:hypothetical protein